MLTHKQVSKLNSRLKRQFGAISPKVIKATNSKDSSRIAIHLLNPSERELDDALETALRDNFPAIVIHTARTFAKRAA